MTNSEKKRYFDLYPKHRSLYFTSDGNCFLEKSPAVNHALKSKLEWEEVKRGEIANVAPVKNEDKKLTKNERIILSLDPEKIAYGDLKKAVIAFNITVSDMKQATIIQAIKKAKEKIMKEVNNG